MDRTEFENKLKLKGHRSTPAKRTALDFILAASNPFSAQELIDFLNSDGQGVNKTTVYRQLDALLKEDVIQEVNLNDGPIRYELKQQDCHHHIICKQCGKVEHVELDNTVNTLQQELEEKSGFKIEEHMLEFFGYCADCKR